MAKQAKTAIKAKNQQSSAESKNFTRVIKAVKSPVSGAYCFKDNIIHKDKVQAFLKK